MRGDGNLQENDEAYEGHDGDEDAQGEHAGENDALGEGRVQAHDVGDGHDDEDEVENYIRDGAAEVDVADGDAFGGLDGDVPGGLDGDAIEDYAEELHGRLGWIE